MPKVTFGPKPFLYPTPTVLVGANVDGKSNFMAVAWCGIINGRPPMLSVALQHPRYTLKGVRQNNTFSVNIPSVDLVKETDYCGIASGSKTDKAADCKFNIFYGRLETAPLIDECPVNLECRVIHMLDLGSHIAVIGQVEEVHVSELCLTDGKPDIDKIRPFLWVVTPGNEYRAFGAAIGEAFSIGKHIKP
ncbi:MAG: flavin reductase family protein [bacterium]|nr:flavin reductase family protein [bacterium]